MRQFGGCRQGLVSGPWKNDPAKAGFVTEQAPVVFLLALFFARGTGLLMRRTAETPLPLPAAKGAPKPIFGRLGLPPMSNPEPPLR